MKLFIFIEGRFIKHKDGNIYSLDGSFTLNLWKRYLMRFDFIYVVARVKENDSIFLKECYLSNAKNVSFVEIPYYIGPLEYARNWIKIERILSNIIVTGNAYLCRLPGTIGNHAISILRRKKIKYGCEVVGDPNDVFAKDNFKIPFRFLLQWYSTRILKQNIINSETTLYVTEKMLQKMYPSNIGKFSCGVSDVLIEKSMFASSPKLFNKKNNINLLAIGTLSQMYKSPDIIIRAIYELKKMGVHCNLIWLGDGVYKRDMEIFAKKLDLINQINFLGNVPKEDLFKYLNQSDIYIHVSRTEGLPRSLVEAMSCGLPCIATNVGGIPELLNCKCLIDKNNIEQLVNKLLQFINNNKFANDMAKMNLIRSYDFESSILENKRNEFLNELYLNSIT